MSHASRLNVAETEENVNFLLFSSKINKVYCAVKYVTLKILLKLHFSALNEQGRPRKDNPKSYLGLQCKIIEFSFKS